MNRDDVIQMLLGVVLALPIFVCIIDHWLAKIIAILWGTFGWLIAVLSFGEK